MVHRIIHHIRRHHKLHKDHHKLILAVFFTVFIIILTLVFKLQSSDNKFSSKSKAQAIFAGPCRHNPEAPPNNFFWRADCKKSCHSNNDCPQNTQDGRVNPPSSAWCYGFDGATRSWDDWRCLKLEYIGPTAAPTPTNIKLQLGLKFQGILKKPNSSLNKLSVKLTFKNADLSINKSYLREFTIDNDNFIWKNSDLVFDLPPSENYEILIKGPKHLQKRVCDNKPTEPAPASYTCTKPSISIKQADNVLDMTGILLLSGDLPPQNGKIDADDIKLINNNLGKTTAEALRVADLNLDGSIDSQDSTLIKLAQDIILSVKAVDEN